MAVGMDSISDTRFKLHEAAYFLSQMKNNVGDKTDFIFNLMAFVSAARSVTYVMQSQYKKSEDDPFFGGGMCQMCRRHWLKKMMPYFSTV